MEIVTGSRVAKLLGLTKARVEQLAKEGVFKREGRGKYPLEACIQAYVEYREDRIRKSDNVDAADYEKHRARLYKAKADKAEIEARAFAGEFHHADEVTFVVGEMLANFRAKVMAIPVICAPRVADIMDAHVCQGILTEAINVTLTEMGGYDSAQVVRRYRGSNRGGDEPATEADTEPVE